MNPQDPAFVHVVIALLGFFVIFAAVMLVCSPHDYD